MARESIPLFVRESYAPGVNDSLSNHSLDDIAPFTARRRLQPPSSVHPHLQSLTSLPEHASGSSAVGGAFEAELEAGDIGQMLDAMQISPAIIRAAPQATRPTANPFPAAVAAPQQVRNM